MELLTTDCDFRQAKNANFSKRRIEDLPLNTRYIVGKESFLFYVEGDSSVRNIHDELLLINFVFAIELKMQFFTCH